jgi:hypothetical protein
LKTSVYYSERTTCVTIQTSMSDHLDVAARLQRLGRLLDECRVPVTASAGPEADTAPTGLLQIAPLDRIRRLTDEVRSGLECRSDADALDVVTARLLLEDYAAAVRQLRTLANETGRSLGMVTRTLDKDRRFIQTERGRQR